MKIICIDCGKVRIVQPNVLKRPNYKGRCKRCDGKYHKHLFTKKRIDECRYLTTDGYLMVKLSNDNFFYPMAEKNGYVKEHRLVMAQHLGRCLWDWEVVHHKNKPVDDNRLCNLTLETSGSHVAYHNSHGAYRGRGEMSNVP